MPEILHFESVKESRGGYFVEYTPPKPNLTIAIVSLVFTEPFHRDQVSAAMESELQRWMKRYPYRLMMFAYDSKESIIRVRDSDNESCLSGWIDPNTGNICSTWNEAHASPHLNGPDLSDWRKIFHDVPFKTDSERRVEIDRSLQERRNQIRVLRYLFLGWLALFPAAWAIFEYFGPAWVGFSILLFSLWKCFQEGRRVLGYKKASRSEEEKAEKERKMAHYYYHCERNPAGFIRLRGENFEKEAEERVRKEAEELRAPKPPPY